MYLTPIRILTYIIQYKCIILFVYFSIVMNKMKKYLHDLVYNQDPDGLVKLTTESI